MTKRHIKELNKILKRTDTIEELEKIRQEIGNLEHNYFDSYLVVSVWDVSDIISKHIAELKESL